MLYDAHNHLHDARLAPHRGDFLPALTLLEVRGAVVNGTREGDWEAVAEFAAEHGWVLPSFGLHPWQAPQRSSQWLNKLQRQLDAHPGAGVGEIGLDRWIKDHDLNDQRTVFAAQLALAAERNLPVTIHCIQAWGALDELLRSEALPARGYLIHAYGGPAEMVDGFVERGGYFSFSPYFLHERKAAQREVFAALPMERVLVETDAPDLLPPDERNAHPLQDAQGEQINDPANLEVAYAGLAEIRGMPLDVMSAAVETNFRRFFGS